MREERKVFVIAVAVAALIGVIGLNYYWTNGRSAAVAVILFLVSSFLRSFMIKWRPSRVFCRPNESRLDMQGRISRRL